MKIGTICNLDVFLKNCKVSNLYDISKASNNGRRKSNLQNSNDYVSCKIYLCLKYMDTFCLYCCYRHRHASN